MSLYGVSGGGCHLTITAPGAVSVGVGDYTVAVLYKPYDFSNAFVWRGYQSSNFSYRGLYFDGDMWLPDQQADTNISNYATPPAPWYWLVVTRAAADEAPRAHYAVYTASGAMTWTHLDALSTQVVRGNIDRFCLGDEFGTAFRGHIACMVAITHEMTDGDIETLFQRSSAGIVAATPQYFTHWPEAAGFGSPFADIAGGGVETARSGTWDVSADPPSYDFALVTPRSGKAKRWDGSAWVKHSVKTYDGSIWVVKPIKGYDGTDWVVSK